MKNILVASQHFRKGGGAARSAFIIANELSQKNNIFLFSFFKSKNSFNSNFEELCLNLDERNFKLILFRLLYFLINCKKIKKFIYDNKISDVITNSVGSELPFLILKLCGVKFNLHICVRLDPKRLFKSRIKKLFVSSFFRLAKTVIVSTKASKQALIEDFELKNVHTINNFFSVEAGLKKSKEHLELTKGFNFITVGRLDYVKRIEIIIKAFRKFHSIYPNSNLYILGDGHLKDNLILLSKNLNIQNKVFFEGNVENVYKYLSKSDLFLFTSKNEGFGNVLVESLISNLPVISTDCDFGPREILTPEVKFNSKLKYPYFGKYGILISKNDDKTIEEELFEAMESFYKKDLLRSKYSNLLERANFFDIKNQIKKWEIILK